MTRCRFGVLVTVAAWLLCGRLAFAQVVGGPVRQDSGPLRELSTNAGAGSRSVREGAGGLRDGNAGPLTGNSVRGSVSGDLVSGPVSEISAGPVTSGFRASGRRTVSDLSVGAVTKDIDSPLREVGGAPVHGFGQLQDRLREIQPLPRNAMIPVEPPPDGAVQQSEEDADIDQPQPDYIAAEPPYAVPDDGDTPQTAEEATALEQPDLPEAEELQ